jgi:hypothetical protein
MPAVWEQFIPGERVGTVTVRAVLNPDERYQRKLLYRIVHHCCGTERVISHAALLGRVRRRKSLCAACATAEVNRQRAAEAAQRERPPQAPISIPPPGLAGVYHHLGPLGPRHR